MLYYETSQLNGAVSDVGALCLSRAEKTRAITFTSLTFARRPRLVDQPLQPERSRGDEVTLTSISTSKGFIP